MKGRLFRFENWPTIAPHSLQVSHYLKHPVHSGFFDCFRLSKEKSTIILFAGSLQKHDHLVKPNRMDWNQNSLPFPILRWLRSDPNLNVGREGRFIYPSIGNILSLWDRSETMILCLGTRGLHGSIELTNSTLLRFESTRHVFCPFGTMIDLWTVSPWCSHSQRFSISVRWKVEHVSR